MIFSKIRGPVRYAGLLIVLAILFAGTYHTLNRSYKYVHSDSKAYYLIAKNLAHGLGYTEGERSHWRDALNRVCPLYIASLAGILKMFPEGPEPWKGQIAIDDTEMMALLLFQVLLYVICAILLYLVGRKVFSEEVGRWAGILGIFIPDFVTYSGKLASETPGLALILGGALAIFYYLDKMTKPWLAWLGFALWGSGILIRPNILLPAGLTALYIFFKGRRMTAVVGLVLIVLILTPFTLRNLEKHGKLWYATSAFSYNLLIGNMLGSIGECVFNEKVMSDTLGVDDHRFADLVDIDKGAKAELWRLIKEEPGHLIKINLSKFFRYWSVVRTSANEWIDNNAWIRRATLAVSIPLNSWVYILGPIGLALCWRRSVPARMMLILGFLLFATAVPMYLNHRHRFIFYPFAMMGSIHLTLHLWREWYPKYKELGLKGVIGRLDRVQKRWFYATLGWATFVLGGTLFDGIYRFERFLNYIIGENRYY